MDGAMTIGVDRADAVVTITLRRPAKLNAMTDDMWQSLGAALATVTPPTDRVVVLTGTGGTFCSGSDVGGLLNGDQPLDERIRTMNDVLLALHELPVPTIAAVSGVAAGAGANLALLCDFVLAADDARFSELFIRRGLSLDSGASWLLPRLVGDRRARQVAMLGDTITAPTAERWGLITTSVAAADLAGEVAALAGRLAALPQAAIAGTKRLLLRSWETDLAGALAAETDNQVSIIGLPEAHEAIARYLR
jgi:enoyl-CoA hydratase/carnithine racemase